MLGECVGRWETGNESGEGNDSVRRAMCGWGGASEWAAHRVCARRTHVPELARSRVVRSVLRARGGGIRVGLTARPTYLVPI